MLRSVFSVGHGRLAVAFEGGHVLEVGENSSGETSRVEHLRHGSNSSSSSSSSTPSPTTATDDAKNETASSQAPQDAAEKLEGTGAAAATTQEAGSSGAAVDIAYSADASMVAVATEHKQVCVWRTGAGLGTAAGTTGAPVDPGDAIKATMEAAPAEAAAAAAAASGHVMGKRELPKKPTSILFAPVVARRADGAAATREKTEEVVVVSDKCGDAYAAPLPDPSSALKHLLGHTAMTITAMVTLKGGQLLATADRAEHIRVSQFPRTTIVHTYLLGHQDFVSALAAVPGGGGAMLLSGGGDGRVGLWDAEAGRELAMISVRQACQDLADGDDASEGVATMDLEEEEGAKETAAAASGAGGGSGDASSSKNGGADSRGEGEAGGREVTSETPKGSGGGGGGGGVPLSVSCSEDGRTVAVVVSGLEGLLLLNLSRGGGGSEGAEGGAGAGAGASFSLTPRARLQLPSVPIQAGFLDGDLIVALPSASSADYLQAFSLRDGVGEGAVPAETGSAREKCMSINARAREQPNGGLVLQAAVPDDDATEALGGGLRKHKGTRNAGKSPDGWNNFSKRRDKKPDKKRKKSMPRPAPAPPANTAAA